MPYDRDNPLEDTQGLYPGLVGISRGVRYGQRPSGWAYGDPDMSLRNFAQGACRRARAAGYESDIKSVRVLDEHLRRLRYRCYWCKGPFEAIDHKNPLSRGGKDLLRNIVPSCRACNSAKGEMSLRQWYARLRQAKADRQLGEAS